MAKAIKLITRGDIFTTVQNDDKQVCLSTSDDDSAQDLADIKEALAIGAADISVTGATDIGAALVDTDEVLVYDASATANRKSAVSRIYTYIKAKIDAGITIAGSQIFSGLVTFNGGIAADNF